MPTTPQRPSPVAYISLGILTTLSFVPLVVRVVTAALNIALGRAWNLTLFVTLTVLMSGAGAFGAYLIVRYFRACRAEDRAAREAKEAELRAEIERQRAEVERQRAEVDKLYQRMEEVESKSWWTDPKTAPAEEDTVELGSNVVPFQRPPGWTDRQSS
jgi:uncharacterized coiled-coil protein SlyX